MYLNDNQKKVYSLIKDLSIPSDVLTNFQHVLPSLSDDSCIFVCNIINISNAQALPTLAINYIKLLILAGTQCISKCSSYDEIDECYDYIVTTLKNISDITSISNIQDLRMQCRKNYFEQTGIVPTNAYAGEFKGAHLQPSNHEIIIPANVLKIEADTYRFIHWSTLRFENQNEKLKICEHAFAQAKNSTQKSQQIINLTRHINHDVFLPYGHVTEISLGDVSTFEAYMFAGYEELKELINTEQIINIGDYAFEGCNKLKQLYIPNITSVGKHVFKGCSSELKIYTKPDKLPLFANAFTDSFENHRDQFIV